MEIAGVTEDEAAVIRHSINVRNWEKQGIADKSEECQRRKKEALKSWRNAVDRMQQKQSPP